MQKSVINLSLRENPSTGFEWSYEITPEGIVELEDEYYSSNQKNSDIQMVGVGGIHYWKFRTIGVGDVTITFSSRRYGDIKVDKGIIYTYKCDGEQAVLINECLR